MKNQFRRFVGVLCLLVTVAVVITAFVSCGSKQESLNGAQTDAQTVSDKKTVYVTVTDDRGEKTEFTIETDKKTLREALESINLVQGEESEYGLYVKVVNGITADYDKDGAYWAFYKDKELLNTGVDSTFISDKDNYEIVYTK